MRNAVVVLFGLILAGCSEPRSSLVVSVYGEEYIEQQIPAEDVIDGWTITFDRFLISVGSVLVEEVGDSQTWLVFDLAKNSAGEGHRAFGFEQVPVGRYDVVHYRVAPPSAEAVQSGNATAADTARMVAERASVIAEGKATRDGVEKSFSWIFDTDTRYEDCASTAEVTEESPGRVELTIHADHLFYDDLVSEEPNVAFDLIAQSDADDDGVITEAELRAVDLRTQTRYQTGSTGITDLWNFIRQQTTTLGHIDGEGHCHARPAN